MSPQQTGIDAIEEKHAIAILLYLLNHPRSLKSSIYQNISTNPRMPEKLSKLENAGLINMTVNRFEKNSTTVSLTPLGRETAQLFYDAVQVMEGQPRKYNLVDPTYESDT